MSLVDDLDPVWETGELKCGQCDKAVGFGRWQVIPKDLPLGLHLPADEKVHVKRPVIFCDRECLEAHEVRSKLMEGQSIEDWFRDVGREAKENASRRATLVHIQGGKRTVYKGTIS